MCECPEGEEAIPGLPDLDGCDTCTCVPVPCPLPECVCPPGEIAVPGEPDANGCETCACEPIEVPCPLPECVCPLGQAPVIPPNHDENGCEICECEDVDVCPGHMVWKECLGCPPVCGRFKPTPCDPGICIPGCGCPDDLWEVPATGLCIAEAECPLHCPIDTEYSDCNSACPKNMW
eukprot:UN25102